MPDPATSSTPRRADARRNLDALVQAAAQVFTTSGVNAPAKQIADLAGVGVGTLYRHFPRRSDLVVAVFRREVDACADAATTLAATELPADALADWLRRFAGFLAAKRGLVPALHSGDPAFDELPGYFNQRFGPALTGLLDAAVGAGATRDDIDAAELLSAVANLSHMTGGGPDSGRRMLDVLIDGLSAQAPRSA